MMKSWIRRHHWPPPRALVLDRFAMMKRHLLSHVAASLLQLPLLEMRIAGCMWVGKAALATSRRLCFKRKFLSIVSPSSVGLEGDAFGASSLATRSAHVVSPSGAFVIVALVIGSDSAMHAFLPLVIALRTLVLVL